MTLYEMNQAGYHSLPKMARSKILEKRNEVGDWIESFLETYNPEENVYFMLLNNDLHYYTIFSWQVNGADSEAVVSEIFSIVQDLGTLKSIEKNDNGSWEFWITKPDASTDAYYLFDYTQGVIEI